jgi:hypothetical protein
MDKPNTTSFDGKDYLQQLSIDCCIFGYRDGQLFVLVPKLALAGDFYALPSGFILQTESIDQAARRSLEGRTGLKDIYLEQFRVFGDAERSNRSEMDRMSSLNEGQLEKMGVSPVMMEWITRRFVSIGYYALVDMRKVVLQKEAIDASMEWYPLNDLPAMILDHNRMVAEALEALRLNLDRRLIAFRLLPDTFTMREVRELYEAIFDRPFARNNFQKKILDLGVLERLEKKFTGAANRAPYLYRFLS